MYFRYEENIKDRSVYENEFVVQSALVTNRGQYASTDHVIYLRVSKRLM